LASILLFKLKVIFKFDNRLVKSVINKGYSREMKIVFSIHEVSQLTGVPAHTIRFWEKDFNAYLRPAKTLGGQRRYCQSDIEVIRRIKQLRYGQKYTIAGALKEIRDIVKDTSGDLNSGNPPVVIEELLREENNNQLNMEALEVTIQ
jgi:DNA-binding transcriptional MerR regulator